jgi:FKBP-type peptidyl-prolyl cis-trans isomerase
MKKPAAAQPPARAWPVWPLIAAVSLAANAGLVIGLLGKRTPPPAPAETVPAAGPRAWTRELAPYAALGSYMAENNRIPDLKWTPEQFEAFQQGFRASYEGRGLPLDEAATRLRDDISRRVQAMNEGEQPDPVREYFKFLRDKENVRQTASGLHYRITEEGTGETPRAGDTVVISYAARLPDGKSLPALSRTRVKVAVKDLLPGLAEGVQLMRVGGKALLYLPPALSFGENAWPAEIPRGTPVAFFVEMHDVNPAP